MLVVETLRHGIEKKNLISCAHREKLDLPAAWDELWPDGQLVPASPCRSQSQAGKLQDWLPYGPRRRVGVGTVFFSNWAQRSLRSILVSNAG